MSAVQQIDVPKTVSGPTPDGARLEQLASEICKNSCQSTALAIRNGEALSEAKGILQHGEFAKWLQRATEYIPRSAQVLMTLAALAKDRPDVSRLGLSVAYRLAAPSTSDEVRTEILDLAARGEKITLKSVNNAIQRERKRALAGIEPRKGIEFGAIVDRISNALSQEELARFSWFIDEADARTLTEFKNEVRRRLRAAPKPPTPASSLALDEA